MATKSLKVWSQSLAKTFVFPDHQVKITNNELNLETHFWLLSTFVLIIGTQ